MFTPFVNEGTNFQITAITNICAALMFLSIWWKKLVVMFVHCEFHMFDDNTTVDWMCLLQITFSHRFSYGFDVEKNQQTFKKKRLNQKKSRQELHYNPFPSRVNDTDFWNVWICCIRRCVFDCIRRPPTCTTVFTMMVVSFSTAIRIITTPNL